MKTYNEFLKLSGTIMSSLNNLKRLGIFVENDGSVLFNHYKIKINIYDMPFGLSFKQEVALALAVQQEINNYSLNQPDINYVNNFFSLDIDKELINDMSKYI